MQGPKGGQRWLLRPSADSGATHLFSTDQPLQFTRKNSRKVGLAFEVNSRLGVVEELRTV